MLIAAVPESGSAVACAFLAVALAASGIYGVTSVISTQRTLLN